MTPPGPCCRRVCGFPSGTATGSSPVWTGRRPMPRRGAPAGRNRSWTSSGPRGVPPSWDRSEPPWVRPIRRPPCGSSPRPASSPWRPAPSGGWGTNGKRSPPWPCRRRRLWPMWPTSGAAPLCATPWWSCSAPWGAPASRSSVILPAPHRPPSGLWPKAAWSPSGSGRSFGTVPRRLCGRRRSRRSSTRSRRPPSRRWTVCAGRRTPPWPSSMV